MAASSPQSELISASTNVAAGDCLLIHFRALFTDRLNVSFILFSGLSALIVDLRHMNCFFLSQPQLRAEKKTRKHLTR
jgi:hypothetical protein